MPGMNGEDLFNTIRYNSSFTQIPIIMLTSVSEDHMTQRLLQNGLNAILTKPARSSPSGTINNGNAQPTA